MTAVWINQLLQGVMLGGLYTLFATGLSLSAGVMRFVNIAHGDFIVLACFVLLLLTTALGLNPVVATLVVLPIAFSFGFGLQRFLLQRVVGENVLLVILVTFALSIIIENGLLEGFGADPQKISGGWIETATIGLGHGINVGVFQVVTFVAAVPWSPCSICCSTAPASAQRSAQCPTTLPPPISLDFPRCEFMRSRWVFPS